ncbi:hypothetical protein [Salinispora arenicola]|uniref:hypothetical protein n=1 Tax=Salinispora arenicola TaxID=168697 RepID=UPI0003A337CB|nr:hypothetical protein [Salinispora arenicola]
MAVVVAYWAEHLVQAAPDLGSRLGAAGGTWRAADAFPWLVSSAGLYYGYAILPLVGLFLLLPGFTGRAKACWTVALALRFWHHIEHALLLIQAHRSFRIPGEEGPVSILQLVVLPGGPAPVLQLGRLHPMLITMYSHLPPNETERAATRCSCAGRLANPRQPAAVAGRRAGPCSMATTVCGSRSS